MNSSSKGFGTRQIAFAAILLAICIVSQIFKNLSIFITGPVVNACLVLAVLVAGLPAALALSVITPVTAFFIAASPVMNAVPWIIPFIMGGNVVLVVLVQLLLKKPLTQGPVRPVVVLYALVAALGKGVFMGLTISLWLLPMFISEESGLYARLPVFQTMFSMNQFLTACIGFVYAFAIWAAWKKFGRSGQS